MRSKCFGKKFILFHQKSHTRQRISSRKQFQISLPRKKYSNILKNNMMDSRLKIYVSINAKLLQSKLLLITRNAKFVSLNVLISRCVQHAKKVIHAGRVKISKSNDLIDVHSVMVHFNAPLNFLNASDDKSSFNCVALIHSLCFDENPDHFTW